MKGKVEAARVLKIRKGNAEFAAAGSCESLSDIPSGNSLCSVSQFCPTMCRLSSMSSGASPRELNVLCSKDMFSVGRGLLPKRAALVRPPAYPGCPIHLYNRRCVVGIGLHHIV